MRRLLEPMEGVGVNMDYLADLMGSTYQKEKRDQVRKEHVADCAVVIDDSYFLKEQERIPLSCSACKNEFFFSGLVHEGTSQSVLKCPYPDCNGRVSTSSLEDFLVQTLSSDRKDSTQFSLSCSSCRKTFDKIKPWQFAANDQQCHCGGSLSFKTTVTDY